MSVDEKKFCKTTSYTIFPWTLLFLRIWRYFGKSEKCKILGIIAEGKGIIPYGKIVDTSSMFLVPENEFFFEETEFYSDLKQKSVSDSDYESSFYLYKTLKMRNLGDMNDLNNAQDVILLCEIGENRFQFMPHRYGFKLRKCNSASTLSVCIGREMSRVVIELPTSNEAIDIFEQTITGAFSSVNTRLAFDTEIL